MDLLRKLSIVIVLACAGCMQQKVIVWDPDSSEAITHFQKPVVKETDNNYALCELYRAELFYKNGDRQHSDTRLKNALNVMDQIESDKNEAGAVALNEYLRTYRGQPYERATAYFYRGLCQFQLGRYESALAAFRASLAEDEETNNDDPIKRKDFVMSYLMAALCLKALDENNEAEAMLASARELSPEHPLLKPEIFQNNTIVVAGVGVGPWMRQGAFWTVQFEAGKVPDGNFRVLENDKVVAPLHEVTDLLIQAESHKAGGATGAAVARGVAKEAVNMVFSVLLGGQDAGIHENRDLRCWTGIPRKFYIGSFNLKPGLHNLTFDIVTTKEKEQAQAGRYQQTWFDIPIADGDHPNLVYVRLLTNGQNFYDLVPVPLQDALAAKAENNKK